MDFSGFFHATQQFFINLLGPDTAEYGTPITNPPTPPPDPDPDTDGSFSPAFSSAFD